MVSRNHAAGKATQTGQCRGRKVEPWNRSVLRPFFLITVSGSSKKAGKSLVAARIVRELKADIALKASSGVHFPSNEAIIEDSEIIGTPGTDTSKLLLAGAKRVAWLNVSREGAEEAFKELTSSLPANSIIVAEGNTALRFLKPDLAIFLAASAPDSFKPSALLAFKKAQVVLVNLSAMEDPRSLDALLAMLKYLKPSADIIVCKDGLDCAEKACAFAIERLKRSTGAAEE